MHVIMAARRFRRGNRFGDNGTADGFRSSLSEFFLPFLGRTRAFFVRAWPWSQRASFDVALRQRFFAFSPFPRYPSSLRLGASLKCVFCCVEEPPGTGLFFGKEYGLRSRPSPHPSGEKCPSIALSLSPSDADGRFLFVYTFRERESA